jgi:1-acyl-sn-glycerol-3-phosphate acyltransferase
VNCGIIRPQSLRAAARISLLIGWTLIVISRRSSPVWRSGWEFDGLMLGQPDLACGSTIHLSRDSHCGSGARRARLLVANHISWVDFTAINAVCKARYVVMAETVKFPL